MKLTGKIVLITGASSGIGRAIAIEAAKLGADVIITARRTDKLTELKNDLIKTYAVDVLSLELDVSKQKNVEATISGLTGKWANIDILVNNAGLALGLSPFQGCKISDWNNMIDVNVKGLLYVTHAVLPIMIKNNRGHIVNIGSVAGHQIYPNGNVYSATKHAVNAISQSLRVDLLGKPIRVTEIDPGAVGDSEFSTVRFNSKEKSDEFYSKFTPLLSEDIADAVGYCITRKENVNISNMTIYPIDQASVNHLNRQN